MSDRPKTLLYGEALADAERRIVEALPDVIEGLITRAREGDTRAAVYLCDRVLGRVAGSKVAPADDRRAPFTAEDFDLEQRERESDRWLRVALAAAGAEEKV